MPPLFKGIALFTPGGDLAYCIDVHKQSRWHLHLCTALQDRLNLPEPPYFLVPCYTATVDRWQDPKTSQILTVAEARPLVMRHRSLLYAVFGIDVADWKGIPVTPDLCDPQLLVKYRQRFPQLWQSHDLVMQAFAAPQLSASEDESLGCVLTLFVAGQTDETETTLTHVHQALEQSSRPYSLKVIDIHKHPDQMAAHQITATPTLIKTWPPPTTRLAERLDNAAQITAWLESNL